jgi:hypothetical protein
VHLRILSVLRSFDAQPHAEPAGSNFIESGKSGRPVGDATRQTGQNNIAL